MTSSERHRYEVHRWLALGVSVIAAEQLASLEAPTLADLPSWDELRDAQRRSR